MSRVPAIVRIATRSAFDQRFRAAALIAAALLSTWAVLLCVSAVAAQGKEEARLQGRSGLLASEPEATDVFALTTIDRWRGESITVINLEPAGTPSANPPGLQALPAPGRAAVTPALADAMASDPRLAARYDAQMQIGTSGVVHGGELLAYVTVPTGSLSGDGAAIMHSAGGSYSGEGPVLRLAGFGSPGSLGPDALPITVGYSDGIIDSTSLAIYAMAVGLPALILVAVALAVASPSRDRRLTLLRFIGVSRRGRLALVVVEPLVPSAMGVLVAAATWPLISRREWILATAGHRLLPGDGDVTVPALSAASLAVVTVIVAAAAVSARSLGATRGARVLPGRRAVSRAGLVPAAAAVGLLVAALLSEGQARGDLAFAGTALAVVAAPMVLPILLRVVGEWVAGRKQPTAWLAGRVMAHDPARSGRPFAGIAALAMVLGASAGFLAVASYTEDPPGGDAGPQVIVLEWRGGGDDPLPVLRERLQGTLLVRHAMAPGSDPTVVGIDAPCAALVQVFPEIVCAPSGDVAGPGLPEILDTFAVATEGGAVTGLRLMKVDPPPDGSGTRDSVLVLGRGSAVELDQRVRTAAAGVLPVSNVVGLAGSVSTASPLLVWIHSGVLAAAVLLAVACLITLRDRFTGLIGQHGVLGPIGLGTSHFTRLALALFAVPYSVAAAAGLSLGVLSCVVFSAKVGVPWGDLGVVAGTLLAAGVLTGAALPRAAVRERAE